MKDKILDYELRFLNRSISGRKVVTHPLFSGSAVMFLGSNIANFLAYLYHLIIGRLLGPASYSELAATIATLGIITSVFTFLGLVVTKFSASATKEEKSGLFLWFQKVFFIIALVLFLILLVASPLISNFLKIKLSLAVLIAPIIFASVVSLFYRAFLQGLLMFGKTVALSNTELFSRLIFGVLFVYLGYSSFGAVLGIVIGAFVALFLGTYFLKSIRTAKKMKPYKDAKKILLYSIPVLIFTISSNSFIFSDVILVKHFLSSYEAGIYASMSTLSKIIFFGTTPVASVMFPLISKRKAQGEKYSKIIFLSLFMTAFIAGAILTIYGFFPQLMVSILYGEKYIEAAHYLVWFGLFIAIYSLCSLLLSFYLSLENSAPVYMTPVFAIIQIVGIVLFHNDLISVIRVSISSISIFLLALLIYFVYERKNEPRV